MKTAVLRDPRGLKIAFRPNRGERQMAQLVMGSPMYQKYYKIGKGDVVLDVGAHIGIFAVKAGEKVGDAGKVISIEPASDNYSFLEKNITMNKLDGVCVPIKCAAGEASGVSKLRIYRTSLSDSLYERRLDYEFMYYEEVEVKTIDDLIREHGVDRVDFMKINVEGSELSVMKGASRTLGELHPKMAVDTHDFGPRIEMIEEYLKPFGYHKREPMGQINYFA